MSQENIENKNMDNNLNKNVNQNDKKNNSKKDHFTRNLVIFLIIFALICVGITVFLIIKNNNVKDSKNDVNIAKTEVKNNITSDGLGLSSRYETYKENPIKISNFRTFLGVSSSIFRQNWLFSFVFSANFRFQNNFQTKIIPKTIPIFIAVFKKN